MYTISTFYIKSQIPGISLTRLVQCYQDKLENQRIKNLTVDYDIINFTNTSFPVAVNKISHRFSNFSKGQIRIEETDSKFIVHLEAELGHLFTSAGIIGAGITLLFVIITGFGIKSFFIGGLACMLFLSFGYFSLRASFPVYFASLRNEIEEFLRMN